MKVFLITVFTLTAISAAQAACGCLKCSKNLYVASPPTSPVQVIYRDAGPSSLPSTRSRLIPYTVEQPIIRGTRPVVLRDHTYTLAPMKVVKKEVLETPESYYGYQVEVPVQKRSSCHKCLVGLVAQTDRVVLPAPNYREIETGHAKGPVFEPLTNVDEEECVYEPYPINQCPYSRYDCSVLRSRLNEDVDEENLTQTQIENNIEQNIREIFFDDSPMGRIRRFFHFSLPKIVQGSLKSRQRSFRKIRKKRSLRQDDEINDISTEVGPRATDLLLTDLNWEQVIPQVPLLFFVNAPVRLMARFHSLNKHLEPVFDSMPKVVQTSSRFMHNYGQKLRDGFVAFLRLLMNVFSGRSKRDLKGHYQLIPFRIYRNKTADFALFNPHARRQDVVVIVVNHTTETRPQMQLYVMNINSKEKPRKKRNLFETRYSGDSPEFLRGLLADITHYDRKPPESAEAIFQEHLKQVPQLHDAFKGILEHRSRMKLPSRAYQQQEPLLGGTHQGDFGHLHPEKNLNVIKNELSHVLDILHKLLSSDIDREMQIYEMLLKLQYLKSTLVVDWRKDLQSPRANVATAKVNILKYIEEIDSFRSRVNKRLLAYLLSHIDTYNRSECVHLLVQLYKLQLIFKRITEDLSDRVKMRGGKFSIASEMNYVEQLNNLMLLDETNKLEVEQHLKALRDSCVKTNIDFLDKLRYLSQFQDENGISDERREQVNEVARMIQENTHCKSQQVKIIKGVIYKVQMNQNVRKDLKNLWDLDKNIAENEVMLMQRGEHGSNLMMKDEASKANEEETKKESGNSVKVPNLSELIKLPTIDLTLKGKLTEFVKIAEKKRESWRKKVEKLAQVMSEDN